ncbi:dimethylamine monooxygenase subunit DmmA family protein [Fictibacillus halophilus]|uniref:dimethylamine monooxygenase subunit DmmA family protein n=1 Tax=Fictibacillus halophilus TaxID=1610490 RepID=UPI001CF9A73D|nr:dimethylamine monooxygenase subunit DmmA family protein [Fictibacillus halophilus]
MSSEAVFVSGKRKYVFCGDQQGIKILSSLIERVKEEELLLEIFLIEGGTEWSQLSKFLKDQKMGTYLYVVLPNEYIQKAEEVAEATGFSDEEAQYIGYGEKVTRVYCCRCHGIKEMKNAEEETLCEHCGLELSVSDHYSVYHNAVLGYVAKL